MHALMLGAITPRPKMMHTPTRTNIFLSKPTYCGSASLPGTSGCWVRWYLKVVTTNASNSPRTNALRYGVAQLLVPEQLEPSNTYILWFLVSRISLWVPVVQPPRIRWNTHSRNGTYRLLSDRLCVCWGSTTYRYQSQLLLLVECSSRGYH